MADLKSEQIGILQMDSSKLLEHIMAVRTRRRDRSKPATPKRVAKKKNPLGKVSDDQIRKLLEMAGG